MASIDIEINNIQKKGICINKGISYCKKCLGAVDDEWINIYDLTYNLNIYLKNKINANKVISNIDFNPKYQDVILSIPHEENLELCKISESDSYDVISILNGPNSKGAQYAKFNPNDENKIISSKYKIIDIWDITKYINIKSIKIGEIVNHLKWDISGNYFGYYNYIKGLNISDMENKNTISIDVKDLTGFEFRNNQDIISFHRDNSIKIWDIRKYDEIKAEIKDAQISDWLYDKNNDFIYTQYKKFQIYELNNFHKIYEDNNKYDNIVLLDTCFLNSNEIANILESNKNGSINIIKVKDKKKIDKSSDKYIENIVYKISDYTNFDDYINKKNEPDYQNKNYIYIQDIKDELEIIENESLPQRKKIVEKEIKNNTHEFGNIDRDYIYYIKLLIRDNTNKILVEQYLKFLKINETELEKIYNNNLEKFDNEVKFYEVIFTKEEYHSKFNARKTDSEREKLINFLLEVKNSDIFQFRQLISKIKTMNEYPYFNQPITKENEELLFFNAKLTLFNGISQTDYSTLAGENQFKSQVKIINEIINEKYLYSDNIIKNKNRLNILIALIAWPGDDVYNKYLLNLLNSSTNTEEEIQEITAELKKNENKELVLKFDFLNGDNKYICKKNLLEYLQKNLNGIIKRKSDLYIYDRLLEEKEKEIDLSKIKTFLKDILHKPMFKKIFELLYKKKELQIIQKDSFIDDYIDNHLFLIPYKGVDYCGLTDRFSCDSYIFFDENILSYQNVNDKVSYALKTSRFIIITLHEFNHYIYSYILHLNNYISLSFDSPRNKELIINEGGILLELMLFGEVINKISLEQTIYLLDEKNYDKTHLLFQREFNNIKDKKLSIQGSYYCALNTDIINQKDFQNKRSIAIKAKMTNDDGDDIKISRKHCVL